MKRLLAMLPVLVFCLLFAPAALAATETVSYIDGDGSIKEVKATVVESGSTGWYGYNTEGWYVVKEDVTIDSRVYANGDIKLILADNATLNANEGICVNDGNSLTIYAQSGESGKLIADATKKGYNEYSGIGGDSAKSAGTITIYGGTVEAKGYCLDNDGGYGEPGIGNGHGVNEADKNKGVLNIYGGVVFATGSVNGAGIGGGGHGGGGITVNIHGGNVTAIGGKDAAGIGGGYGGGVIGTVTITDGTVTATGGENGAGIGGGNGIEGVTGGTVAITGGTVNATGKNGAAGIGGSVFIGTGGDGATVTIGGGTVTAIGGEDGGVAIGGGNGASSNGSLTINPASGLTIAVKAGTDGGTASPIGTYKQSQDIINEVKTYAWFQSKVTQPVTGVSLDKADMFLLISEGATALPTGTLTATVAPAEADNKNVTWATDNEGIATVDGSTGIQATVTAVAPGDTTITVTTEDGGYKGTCTVHVRKQVLGVPYLDETGTERVHTPVMEVMDGDTVWSDMLGDGWYVVTGTVTIPSGVVVSGDVHLILADGATLNVADGIKVTDDNSLTVYAQSTGDTMGTLTATGAVDGAGIGGGSGEKGGTVTINGGKVTATGGTNGAGIGGGNGADGGAVTINGGIVEAAGKNGALGIGAGANGAGNGTVMIGTPAAGMNTTVKAGNGKDSAVPVDFTEGQDISGLLNGAACFYSETKALPVPTAKPAAEDKEDSKDTTTTTSTQATPAPTAVPDDGVVYYTCPACGHHNWTAIEGGYRCDTCGYVESVKQLSGYGNVKGSYTPGSSAGGSAAGTAAAAGTASAIPQTGDDSAPALWLGLLVCSALGLGGVYLRKRKLDR